jgi:hypothetical protein
MRQNNGSAHHLVGVLGVNAQTHRQIDGLVKLRKLHFLNEWYRIDQGVWTGLYERAPSPHSWTASLPFFPRLPPYEPLQRPRSARPTSPPVPHPLNPPDNCLATLPEESFDRGNCDWPQPKVKALV